MQPRFRKCLLVWMIMCLATTTFATIPPDSSGSYASFDHTRIHFTIKGKGTPVILLHGFMQQGDAWFKYPLYDSLIRQGYCVITPDLRGNGLSDKPHEENAYANDAEARDIMALADHLHLNAYKIVGYSRGAIIASRVLLLDNRVRCGVMGGMGTAFTNPGWPRRWLFYRALSGENVPELAAMVKNVQSAGLDQQALALQQKEQPASTPQELAGIHKPVLVIGGDKDEDNDTGGALAAMMPTGMHATVTGDHNSTVRSPYFAAWVIDFLQNH
ncbi:pimeloyl-ACP methyl ester carboxylesterase [Chitinophaga dinghuensis]|uniref:Pimeloyl-ACP methyl ester carboxylesterase n=1 Tax=Chitinophaga dinghuensis TaxID=1539050 RepID=A0A327VVF3_9BACT|nr:alpha/beta hydrolase [Chitinophaga dinghuensis]RAJ79977.1 pimeloyl-ACP methyl ester carboxylesterase [Chitinophaga dinghuensis]